MNLQNISNPELIQRLEKLVRTERKISHLVLLHILEIKSRKIFANLGFENMFSYLTKGLGYSESCAYRRLQSAKLLAVVPEVAQHLENGSLKLSQLTQVQKYLTEEEKKGEPLSLDQTKAVLEKLENKNSFETEKILSLEFNKPLKTSEVIKPQKDDSVRLELTLNQEQFAALESARNLLSHVCPDGSWADVIATLAKKFNQTKLGRTDTALNSSTLNNADLNCASSKNATLNNAPFKNAPVNNSILKSTSLNKNVTQSLSEVVEKIEVTNVKETAKVMDTPKTAEESHKVQNKNQQSNHHNSHHTLHSTNKSEVINKPEVTNKPPSATKVPRVALSI